MVEPRVCTGGDSVTGYVRADAAAGKHRVAGESRPRRDRATMSNDGREVKFVDRPSS